MRVESAPARGGQASRLAQSPFGGKWHSRDVVSIEVTTVDWADFEVFDELVEQVKGKIEQIDAMAL